MGRGIGSAFPAAGGRSLNAHGRCFASLALWRKPSDLDLCQPHTHHPRPEIGGGLPVLIFDVGVPIQRDEDT